MKWVAKEVEIKPGPLPWGSELGKSIPVPGLISALSMLANPFPRTVNAQLYDDVQQFSTTTLQSKHLIMMMLGEQLKGTKVVVRLTALTTHE